MYANCMCISSFYCSILITQTMCTWYFMLDSIILDLEGVPNYYHGFSCYSYATDHNYTSCRHLWRDLLPIDLLFWILKLIPISLSIQLMAFRPSVADWGCGMSVCCTTGPIVRYRRQWMAAWCATVSLAHANQLPLPRLWSAVVRVCSCKQRYSKYPDLSCSTCCSMHPCSMSHSGSCVVRAHVLAIGLLSGSCTCTPSRSLVH